MAKRRKNPSKAEHKKQSGFDLERADRDIERARKHLRDQEPGRALQEVALSLAAASCARCEAENAGEPGLSKEAAQAMRDAGDVLLEAVAQIQEMAGAGVLVANPNGRHPAGTPNFLIRTHSSSLLAGSSDIYLVVNTDGEVMDAVITEFEDFGPIEDAGYHALSILELDVSGGQHRKLLKLAKQLQTVVGARPVFRPGTGRRAGTEVLRVRRPTGSIKDLAHQRRVANPLKRKLMGS
jgi:hypothetical protein